MSPDGPSSEAVPGTVDVLSYASLAQACTQPDAVDRLRELLHPVVHRCLDRWAVVRLLDAEAPAADAQSAGVLAQANSKVRRVVGRFKGSPETWAAQAGMAVDAFLEQWILWVTLDGVVASVLRTCLDQWDLRCLHDHQTRTTDSEPSVWSEELLARIRWDLRGDEKFVGSRTTWREQAAARMETFLEQRILLVTTRYCSLPRRRAVVGPEPFARLVGRLSRLDDHACVLPGDELEELWLVAAAQGGDSDAFGILWERTRTSIRGAVRGRYEFGDDVVDDLVGETNLSLVESISNFDASLSTFRAFARGVARHRVADYWRAQDRLAKALEPNGDGAAGEDQNGESNAVDPDAEVEATPGSKDANSGRAISLPDRGLVDGEAVPRWVPGAGERDSQKAEAKTAERIGPREPVALESESGRRNTASATVVSLTDAMNLADKRIRDPDDVILARELLGCAFRGASPLHQKLALGYNVLHEYRPGDIVDRLWDQPFPLLCDRMIADYPADAIHGTWIPQFAPVFANDLRTAPASQLTFERCYEPGRRTKPEKVSDWVFEIKQRTLRDLAIRRQPRPRAARARKVIRDHRPHTAEGG